MWLFLATVALLGRNQAAPLAGSSFLLTLQQQQAQTTASSAIPAVTQQQASSSSSSSSSSSDTSESSQSSEGPQQVRERQNLENTAVEQLESSQESAEVLRAPGLTSLLLRELVALGQRHEGRDAGEDGGRHRALTPTFHPLTRGQGPSVTSAETRPAETRSAETRPAETRPAETRPAETRPAETRPETTAAAGDEGEEADAEPPDQLLDDSTEEADGPTFNLLGHRGYHGNEAGLELGL